MAYSNRPLLRYAMEILGVVYEVAFDGDEPVEATVRGPTDTEPRALRLESAAGQYAVLVCNVTRSMDERARRDGRPITSAKIIRGPWGEK
jgi:hypothetical protein